MKKRYFLQAGAVMLGTAYLSRYLSGRSQVTAIAKNEFEITKTEEEWRKILTPEQFSVLRKHGTEPAHTSSLDKQYAKGTYVCAGCNLPLFTEEMGLKPRPSRTALYFIGVIFSSKRVKIELCSHSLIAIAFIPKPPNNRS